MTIARRLPLLVAAMLALLAGLAGALVRLDFRLPEATADLSLRHGPLMVSGFLGTVIALERAVALGGLAYVAPVLTALAALALVSGVAASAAPLLAAAGSAAMLVVFARLLRRDAALYLSTMTAGVMAWLAGNLLWLDGWALYRVAPWWAGFLVLVIAGERLELTRVLPMSARRRAAFVAAAAILGLGIVASAYRFDAGVRLSGAGMIAIAAWLGRNDIARRTVCDRGLPRFMAVCLLAGYLWLAVAGVLWLWFGGVEAGLGRDASLHALFLGFVFGMIFAHAPVIFPSVLGTRFVYSPAFYSHVALLQATLVLRVGADLALWRVGQEWGGFLNAFAILLFLGNTLRAIVGSHGPRSGLSRA